MRSGRVLSAGASVSVALGVSPGVDVLSSLEALQPPYHWDFMKAPSHRHGQLLIQFPAPLSSLENEE